MKAATVTASYIYTKLCQYHSAVGTVHMEYIPDSSHISGHAYRMALLRYWLTYDISCQMENSQSISSTDKDDTKSPKIFLKHVADHRQHNDLEISFSRSSGKTQLSLLWPSYNNTSSSTNKPISSSINCVLLIDGKTEVCVDRETTKQSEWRRRCMCKWRLTPAAKSTLWWHSCCWSRRPTHDTLHATARKQQSVDWLIE